MDKSVQTTFRELDVSVVPSNSQFSRSFLVRTDFIKNICGGSGNIQSYKSSPQQNIHIKTAKIIIIINETRIEKRKS